LNYCHQRCCYTCEYDRRAAAYQVWVAEVWLAVVLIAHV
jgi:hypothetical protein